MYIPSEFAQRGERSGLLFRQKNTPLASRSAWQPDQLAISLQSAKDAQYPRFGRPNAMSDLAKARAVVMGGVIGAYEQKHGRSRVDCCSRLTLQGAHAAITALPGAVKLSRIRATIHQILQGY